MAWLAEQSLFHMPLTALPLWEPGQSLKDFSVIVMKWTLTIGFSWLSPASRHCVWLEGWVCVGAEGGREIWAGIECRFEADVWMYCPYPPSQNPTSVRWSPMLVGASTELSGPVEVNAKPSYQRSLKEGSKDCLLRCNGTQCPATWLAWPLMAVDPTMASFHVGAVTAPPSCVLIYLLHQGRK